MSWRIDPDGSLGIRRHFESKAAPDRKLGVDEYYAWMFENSVPGLPEAASREGLDPLAYMRRHGAFEVARGIGQLNEQVVPDSELVDVHVDRYGRIYTAAPRPAAANIAPVPSPDPESTTMISAGTAACAVLPAPVSASRS